MSHASSCVALALYVAEISPADKTRYTLWHNKGAKGYNEKIGLWCF